MKFKSHLFTLLLSASMVFAGVAGASLAKKSSFIEAKADSEPNASLVGVYSPTDFNNTEFGGGFNNVLITYSGEPHGLPADTYLRTSDVLDKITINGTTLTTLGWGVGPWVDQLWFKVIYPSTVVTGDILEIQSGLVIGNAVFGNNLKLRLNSSSKWEVFNSIEDDPLVKNNDYLLFTPSDVSGATNPPTFAFYNPSALTEMANLNFGIQFKLNMTDEELNGYSTLELGNAIATNNFAGLMLNYKHNTYLYTLNGNATTDPLPGLTNISLTPDVDHTIEFYCFKVSESTVCFILGIDGELIFKTSALDITGTVDCHYYNLRMANGANATKVSSTTTTAGAALTRFSNRALHMDTIPTSDESETDACKGENGYYAKAKSYYNMYLVQSQRVKFATEAAYADQRARFVAWAAANGLELSFDPSTGALVESSNRIVPFVDNRSNIALIIAVSTITISTLGFVVLFILKKKKHN